MEMLFYNDKIKKRVCELLGCDNINYQGTMFKGNQIVGVIQEVSFGVGLGFNIQRGPEHFATKTISYKELYELGTSGY